MAGIFAQFASELARGLYASRLVNSLNVHGGSVMATYIFRVAMISMALGIAACDRQDSGPQLPTPVPESPTPAESTALWKYSVKGDFGDVLAKLKTGLQVAQFQLTGEENLAKGLENNKHLFTNGGWNTIGFANVSAIHFCSVVFNQQVFNIKMDWSVLCPFKLVAYSMKATPDEITIVTVRPSVLLANDPHPRAKEIGQTIEDRIVNAIKDGLAH
jgi:uncharacterized protein (DUF302 family)